MWMVLPVPSGTLDTPDYLSLKSTLCVIMFFLTPHNESKHAASGCVSWSYLTNGFNALSDCAKPNQLCFVTRKDLNAVNVPSGVVHATSRHKLMGENWGEGVFSSATLKNSFTWDKDELVFKGVVQKKNKLGKNTVCLLPCAVMSCWGTCWFFSAALRYKWNWVILVESFSLLHSMFFALIVFTAQINSRYIYRWFSRDSDS